MVKFLLFPKSVLMSVGCWLTNCRSVDSDGYCANALANSEAVSEIILGMSPAKQQNTAIIRRDEYMGFDHQRVWPWDDTREADDPASLTGLTGADFRDCGQLMSAVGGGEASACSDKVVQMHVFGKAPGLSCGLFPVGLLIFRQPILSSATSPVPTPHAFN